MRFTTKSEEFEHLKADVLEKLAAYQQAVENAMYEELKNPGTGTPLVTTYSNLVASNAAFRTFLNNGKLQIILGRDIL